MTKGERFFIGMIVALALLGFTYVWWPWYRDRDPTGVKALVADLDRHTKAIERELDAIPDKPARRDVHILRVSRLASLTSKSAELWGRASEVAPRVKGGQAQRLSQAMERHKEQLDRLQAKLEQLTKALPPGEDGDVKASAKNGKRR
jgi:hypothetical protein